jgi:uncharacterized protein YndB with AHSA1/START domain
MIKQYKTKMIAESGKQEIIVTREFNAPRELVFRAWTDANLYPIWIGPRELSTTIEIFEPHLGGTYRFIQTDPAGHEFAFHGVYHEVTAPERIIETFEYEGLPVKGHASLGAVNFESLPGNRTRVTTHSVFLTVADRDGMIAGDMERGEIESYERLDELLEKILIEERMDEAVK